MELLPIIYNSLLIAAGLFVVTVAISYVSYKIKRNRGIVDEVETRQQPKPVVKEKRVAQEELKPRYKKPHPKPVPQKVHKEEKAVVKKKTDYKKKEHEPRKASTPKQQKDSNKRIERVTKLVPSDTTGENKRKKTMEKRIEKDDKFKDKKNLKSIDDDPLKKYTDSSEDDEFHPLKTDD